MRWRWKGRMGIYGIDERQRIHVYSKGCHTVEVVSGRKDVLLCTHTSSYPTDLIVMEV